MSKKQAGPVGHHDLVVLPEELPHDLFGRVIEIFRGKGLDWEDAHYLYHVLGYALRQVHEHPPLVGSAGDLTAEQAADQLEAYSRAKAANAAATEIDWKSILKLALAFLSQLLG